MIRYLLWMKKNNNPSNDLVITFKPDATPEEKDRFLTELAQAILAIARHIVAREDGEELEDIEF